ncbi:coiled-coil domain-containing protein [Lutispora saccharofermentans]|uniref:Chromosome segregation ATPase n=1 Tax=Lutispora saccharofermentans TaxID=3024236 RepID=A0ABT1NLI6_9FIRM|nr:hypothetical protein [Lutispora saccharofermentans]MCQ1531156.1 hypothetical protein [Lutispora saccharofermentans]
MPRLTKIRIVGCRYDSFRKHHENSVYDLTRDGEPDHTLFTLNNQGGKGVLMQLISQIAMPETRWGKQSGNKITSMFYDQNNRLRPYTFHVLLEWKLDTIPDKWLITGMCITAFMRNDNNKEDGEEKDEAEKQAGLSYFLYTHEHRGDTAFTIESIPAYYRRDKKTAEYKDFENFIDDNRDYFIKYSQSSTKRLDSDYYNYLRSKGIVRSEWEILKLINKVEGGVGDYFSRAADNRAIFDRFIIPAISENMKNYIEDYKDSLKEMFKSNLSITKNLPVLLKREGDFRELIYFIEPLIQSSEVGIRRLQMMERCVLEGNNIYASLNNIYAGIERDIAIWTGEKNKSMVKQKELDFEKANLPYVQIIREELKLNELRDKKQEDKEHFLADIGRLLTEKKKYEISQLLLEKQEFHDKESSYIREKDILSEMLKADEVQEKIKVLDEKIKAKWQDTYIQWKKLSHSHYTYIVYMQNKKGKLERAKSKENNYIFQKSIETKRFEDKEEALDKDRKTLAEVFDPFRMAMPELLLEELRRQYDSENERLEELEKRITEHESQKAEETGRQSENKVRIEILERKIKDNERMLEEVKEEEDNLKHRICGELNLDPHKEVYRESWAQNQSYQLSKLVQEKRALMDQLKLELWENNMDKSLNTESYWIPNKDTLVIRDKICGLGITVQLGTEYLSHMDDDEKIELIEKYPMLVYGLLIANEKDWQIIKDNLTEEIFLRSLIPVFIRSQMKAGVTESFKNIAGYEMRLALNPDEYMNWQKEIQDKDEQINGNIRVISDKLELIEKLIRDIAAQQKGESSMSLADRIQGNREELDALKVEKSLLLDNLSKLSEAIKKLKAEESALENQNKNTEDYIAKLEDFINRMNEIEKERLSIKSLKEAIDMAKERIDAIEGEIGDIDGLINGDNLNYERWKLHLNDSLKDIRIVIDNAGFDEQKDIANIDEAAGAAVYKVMDDDFADCIARRKGLAMEIEQKNSKIALINKDIEHIKIDIDRLEKQLKKIDPDWKEYQCFQESKDVHAIKLANIDKELNSYGEKKQAVHDEIIKIKAKLEGLEKEKRKIEKALDAEYSRAPLNWEGIDIVKKEYEITEAIKDNNKYLAEAEGILKTLNEKQMSIWQVISDIKAYRELDSQKGKIDESIMERIKSNPHEELENWISKYKKITDGLKQDYDQAAKYIEEFNKQVKEKVFDETLKDRILQHTANIKIEKYKSNLESFVSMKEHFEREINSITSDKAKAEEVREQWAQRAARHSIKIIESLKEMIAGMNFVNENNHVFPLISLKGADLLPKEESEILYSLKEYFVESLSKLLKENENIENIDEQIIDRLMGDQAIFARAVGGRYPKLMVYKMTEKNEFRYAKPREYYYTSWEAINKGEGDTPEGSGGQTLSVNTFVIMMLMNYRKRYTGNERPWTVLLLDNPFGKASGKHVLDPIFEIANKLNFQLIAFAAPEIIKAEISERFPVFWALKIAGPQDLAAGTVTGEMIHGGRVNIRA